MPFPAPLPEILPNRAVGIVFRIGRLHRAATVLLFLLSSVFCLAATTIKDVKCSPINPRTGQMEVSVAIEAGTNDAPARLAGIVVDRITGRSLGRATLRGCPAEPLVSGQYRVVWNALADAAFRPLNQVELRLSLEPIPAEKEEVVSVEEQKRPDLLYYCTFDDAASIFSPVAGPSGAFFHGEFGPGKTGGALRVERDTAAFETRFSKGMLGAEGCIEFWAKIEGDNSSYVDGGDPLFFSLYDERNSITLLQFAANNGFGRGGLGGAIDSWPFGSVPNFAMSMEYANILGSDWAGWHHYAMSWKADGFPDGSYVKVFVDGAAQPVIGAIDDEKGPGCLADYVNHDYVLGSPWPRSRGDRRRSKKPFWLDEMKIWLVAKTEFDLRSSPPGTAAPPKLLFHCTLDSVDAIASCGGTVTGAEFVEGVKGKAVQVGHAKDPICFPLENTIANFRRGSVEIWAKILEPDHILSSSAHELNLVNLRQVNDDIGNFFRITLTTNNGHGQSGLVGGISTHDKASTHIGRIGSFDIAAAIGGNNPKEWHHYLLSWDVDGIGGGNDRTAVFVDGRKVVSSTEPLFEIKPAWDHYRYILKISESNGNQPWAVFDELKLWDHAIVPDPLESSMRLVEKSPKTITKEALPVMTSETRHCFFRRLCDPVGSHIIILPIVNGIQYPYFRRGGILVRKDGGLLSIQRNT